MEGECSAKQEEKLSLLLKHSIADQVVLDNLRRLRRIVKECDPALAIEAALSDENFMAELHAGTMKRITAQMKMDEQMSAMKRDKTLSSDEDFSLVQASCKT